MNDQVIQIITTAVLAGLLILVGKIYQGVQDWFVSTVLKRQTSRQQAFAQNARALTKLLDLHYKSHDLYESYKSDVKVLVSRSVDNIINDQRDLARKAMEKHLCKDGKCVDDLSLRKTLHDFKSAGESLKVLLTKTYMDSVDTNGFANKSVTEWQNLLNELFNSIDLISHGHYDDWYINDDVPLSLIFKDLANNKSVFYDHNTSLMNRIREKSEVLYQDLENNKKEREDLFNDLSTFGKK